MYNNCQTDEQKTYGIDPLRLKDMHLKSDLYLKWQSKKSHFLLYIAERRTDGHSNYRTAKLNVYMIFYGLVLCKMLHVFLYQHFKPSSYLYLLLILTLTLSLPTLSYTLSLSFLIFLFFSLRRLTLNKVLYICKRQKDTQNCNNKKALICLSIHSCYKLYQEYTL